MTAAPLPLSGSFAWWATAWLRGQVVTDEVLDALAEDGLLHQSDAGEPLVGLLGLLRSAGAGSCGLALPAEGDPLGLGGPRELTELALAAGEAVVADGAGMALVPDAGPEVVTWRLVAAHRRQVPDVGEADRALRRTLLETADALAALDVARWRPEAADLLLGPDAPVPAPPGTPPRCVDLAGRALTAAAVVDVALLDDGGAVSASEIAQRRDALDPLERAARRALVAACSPEVWPPT